MSQCTGDSTLCIHELVHCACLTEGQSVSVVLPLDHLQREHADVMPIQYCSNTLVFVVCCSKWTRCVVKSAMQPSTVALIVSDNMQSFTRELVNVPSSSPNSLQKL